MALLVLTLLILRRIFHWFVHNATKKNPDAAELIRGKSGRIIGNYVSLFNVMKLPLHILRTCKKIKNTYLIVWKQQNWLACYDQRMIESIKFIPKNMRRICHKGFLNATDMADWFVKELKKHLGMLIN